MISWSATTLIKGDVFSWGQIMTGALLGAAPPLIIYAFLMDYDIAGWNAPIGAASLTKAKTQRDQLFRLRASLDNHFDIGCAIDMVHTTLREQRKRGVPFFAIAGSGST